MRASLQKLIGLVCVNEIQSRLVSEGEIMKKIASKNPEGRIMDKITAQMYGKCQKNISSIDLQKQVNNKNFDIKKIAGMNDYDLTPFDRKMPFDLSPQEQKWLSEF